MKFTSTHALLGAWTTAALITTGASAGVVTVTDSLGARVYTSVDTTAALTDAMNWVQTRSGNYSVHAQSGRYDAGTNIASNASLTWGSSPGVIDLMGGMNVQASAQMLFEIAGTNNSNAPTTGVVDYDTVLADGNVTSFGTLSVALGAARWMPYPSLLVLHGKSVLHQAPTWVAPTQASRSTSPLFQLQVRWHSWQPLESSAHAVDATNVALSKSSLASAKGKQHAPAVPMHPGACVIPGSSRRGRS